MAEIETTLNVAGMDCDGCERSIANALANLQGVSQTQPRHADGTVFIRFDDERVSLADIGQAIADAGYELV